MDILSKFEAVTVKADIRLSEADQRFCEAHEAAYHTAQTCFKEMAYNAMRWRLGKYIRLSKEDLLRGRDESNSVINQRRL